MNPLSFEFWLKQAPRTPLLMGVLNVTPDSFSDGGNFLDADDAVSRGRVMLEQGADMIDIGGESTRPGALPVDADEQIRRTAPVIRQLAAAGATLSIDTTSAAVAQAAIDAGAALINDVSAGRFDPQMLSVIARSGKAVILMHMLGSPQTMQQEPAYADVVGEVLGFLKIRAEAALAAGIPRHRILLDVGIGFGKTLGHNLRLLREHGRLAGLGHPTVLGTSRKSFIGALTNRTVPSQRVLGTAATIAWGLANGADILRVHDVQEMREVLTMIQAIRGASD